MLNEQQLEVLSDALRPLFQSLEQDVIMDIARRVKNTMSYTRTAELMAMDMQTLGYSPSKIRAEVMKVLNADASYKKAVETNTIEYKKEIKKMIDDIVNEAIELGDEIISNAGKMSWIDDMSVWESAGKQLTDNSFLHDLQRAVAEQTVEQFVNLTRSTGFKTMSGYESIATAYRRELDKAVIKICTGTFSQEKVLTDVVKNLAQSGLRSIDYANGYSMQLDTAVKNALRTGCQQIAAKIMDENIRNTGENLVYVSKHWGARNKGAGVENHALWQGQVYFIQPGQDYSAEARRIGQDRIMDIWYSTGYSPDGSHINNPLGLHGYNCRHSHRVWFLGASSLPDEQPEPAPVVINGREYDYYAMTQKMRSMEWNIRALKRELIARNGLKLPATEIKAKISSKTREYEAFCKKCNVPQRTTNLKVETKAVDITKTEVYKKYKEVSNRKEYVTISSNNKGGIQMIEQIEQRNTARGKAMAISHFDTELNSRQVAIDNLLKNYDDKCIVRKKDISLSDLSALTAKNNVEYAMFTKGNERLIIRGEEGSVNVSIDYAKELKNQGYKWSGHTHPGNSDFVLMPSDGDYEILEVFKQNFSSIYNSTGGYYIFERK